MRFALVAAALAVLVAGPGHAYTTLGVAWPQGHAVPYYANLQSRDMSPEQAMQAFALAAEAWNATDANVSLVYAGATAVTMPTRNGFNEVFFSDDTSVPMGGQFWFWSVGGVLSEVDIMLRQGVRVFVAEDQACSGGS